MKKKNKSKSKSKSKFFKNIIGVLNIPLIIFLLLVGGLLLISNIKSKPVVNAKQKVSATINDVSKNLNEAANSSDRANS